MKKVERTERGFVLADGEVTGHAHVIKENIDLFEDGNVKFMTTYSPVTIGHEEHKPMTIEEPGEYEIGIVQEFNHFEQAAKQVRD